MIEERNLVSRETAERILTLLNRPGGPGDQRPSRGGALGRMPVIVRCTSATAVGGSSIGLQCYPAVVVAADGTTPTQPELGNVWLTVLGASSASVAPTADALYYGMLSGDFDPGSDNRPRVFAVDSGGAAALTSGSFSPAVITISADNTWTSSATTQSLAAGTYRVNVVARLFAFLSASAATLGASNEGIVSVRLYNSTDAVALSDGVGMSIYHPTQQQSENVSFTRTITLAATKSITIQGLRNPPYDAANGQTWTSASVQATEISGRYTTRVDWLKIA